MSGEGVVKGLQSIGRVQAKISIVVTIVLGVISVIVAIGAFIMRKPIVGGGALLFALLCGLGNWWARETLKVPALQTLGGISAVGAVASDALNL
jgi:hypothetical protein